MDGVWELPKLGDREVYDWVNEYIFDKLLTGEEKKILYIFLGSGYKIPVKLASNKLHLGQQEALDKYESILLKILHLVNRHELDIYFQKII